VLLVNEQCRSNDGEVSYLCANTFSICGRKILGNFVSNSPLHVQGGFASLSQVGVLGGLGRLRGVIVLPMFRQRQPWHFTCSL
jgi:hypothetical protein